MLKHITAIILSFIFLGCGGENSVLEEPTFQELQQKESIPNNKTVNSIPVATFGNFTVNRDVRYSGQLTATDADGDSLKYIIITQPKHGTVVMYDNGCFVYTPDSGYYGEDTFSYRASDAIDSCAVKTVTIDINEPTIEIPNAPTDLEVKVLSSKSLELSWHDNSNNEEGFVIYKDGQLICTTEANQTRKIISCGLEVATTYIFEVEAKNEAGKSTSTSAQGTTKDVTSPPNSPSNLKVLSYNNNCVRLSWQDNSDNESGYEIYQNDKMIKTVSESCLNTLINGLIKCTHYNFTIKAVNKIGSSNVSNEVTIKTCGCEVIENKNVTIAQALKGPLSESHFTITKMSDDSLLFEGTTTKGDGVNVDTAGLIQIPESIKDFVSERLYVINVVGGTDIDIDDDRVWDSNPRANLGEFHSIVSGENIKNGNFDRKVNFITEVSYVIVTHLKNRYSDFLFSENDILKILDSCAKFYLKEDIDGDGDIDNEDVVAWNPANDAASLNVTNNIAQLRTMIEDGQYDELFSTFRIFEPVALDLFVTLDKNTNKAIELKADETSGYGDTFTYRVVTQPRHGIYLNGVYSPNINYYGYDSFTYITNDGYNDSAPATVTITINDVPEPNHAPIAISQSITMDEDTSKSITLSGTDVDGDNLRYIIVTPPSNGTYTNGVYTPNQNYVGRDSFTFKANDGKVDSAPATVTISVNDVVSTLSVELPLSVTSTTADQSALIVMVVSVYVNGVLVNNGDDDDLELSYEWKDGDEIISTQDFGVLAQFIFSRGEHVVTLTVTDTDKNGLSASTVTYVTVQAP